MKAYRSGLVILLAAGALSIAAAWAPASRVRSDESVADVSLLTESLRDVFMAQEIHYSHPINKYTYASDAAQLQRYQPRQGVTATIFEGTALGWSGMVQDTLGNACVMFVGKVSKLPATPRGVAATKPAYGNSLEMACDA